MNFDVFISYSKQGKATADAACAKLEAGGIRCWIAPRDVEPGAEWAGAIVEAIDQCRAMVLIFSSSANQSKQIRREVQRAFESEVPVLPFRIENIVPEKSLAYYMGPVHWLDALTPPLEQHLQTLATSVQALLRATKYGASVQGGHALRETEAEPKAEDGARQRSDTVSTKAERSESRAPWQPSRWIIAIGGVVGVFLVGSIGFWLAGVQRTPVPPVAQAEQSAPPPVRQEPSPLRPSRQAVPGEPANQPPPARPPVPAPATPVQSGPSGIGSLSSEHERALKPRDSFKECDNCPEMIVVPAGRFTMGSPNSDTTSPQHGVTIAQPFAVSKFELTFDEWDACVADGGCNGYKPWDEGWGRGRRPVINVSWNDAQPYLAWLSRKTGKSYRLLSEAEFEHAARAGTTTTYPWGDDIGTNNADCRGCGSQWDGKETAPVGSFAPNAFGLYDLTGNVAEWVGDCHLVNYKGAPADGSARTDGDCSFREVRGGSWDSGSLRPLGRAGYDVHSHGKALGFRVARTLAVLAPVQVPATPVQPASTGVVPLSFERERALKPRDAFKECDKCPEMVLVPSGSFSMGSPEEEKGRYPNETPHHGVTIAKPFAVGRFALTFDEWDACVADGGCKGYTPPDANWGRGRRPVINVSWEDTRNYLAWLSRKTGKSYRLLSEAEFEYTARAGTNTAYYWGNVIGIGNANCNGCGSQWDDKQPAPTGSFAANAFGLYDMSGNVNEWVEDCWHDNYYEAPTDGSAWNSGDCSVRVARGGSFYYEPRLLRSAGREWSRSDLRSALRGFRVARTLTP